MSVRDLLDRISASGSLVPSKATYEGTLEMQERQASSPGSLGSLNNHQKQFAENIELTTVNAVIEAHFVHVVFIHLQVNNEEKYYG